MDVHTLPNIAICGWAICTAYHTFFYYILSLMSTICYHFEKTLKLTLHNMSSFIKQIISFAECTILFTCAQVSEHRNVKI